MNIAETPKFFAPLPRDSLSGAPIGVISRSHGRGKQLGTHMHRQAQILFAAGGLMQVTTPKGRGLVPPAARSGCRR